MHFVVSRRSVSVHGYDQYSHIKPDHLFTRLSWPQRPTSNLKHDPRQFSNTLHLRTLAR